MNKTVLLQKTAKFVVGTSVSFTVGNVLSNNVNPKNALQKAECFVGAGVIGMIVAQHAEEWTDAKTAAAVKSFNELKSKIQNIKKDQLEEEIA